MISNRLHQNSASKMFYKALLLLLPTVAYSQISIRIETGSNGEPSNIDLAGSIVDIISDTERQTWQITDGPLKDAVHAYSGVRPENVFCTGPTPWDLYKEYGWQEVQRVLIPSSAKILSISSEPADVATKDFVNNSNITTTFNAAIAQSVEETASSTWSMGGELTIDREISYTMNIGIGEMGGSTSISYSSSWGKDTTTSKTATVGSESGVSVELQPGESVTAALTASRGTMEVQVDYSATLHGSVACSYEDRYKGHYFWAFNVNNCLTAAGKRRAVDSTERIKIGFYSNARLVLSNTNSGQNILDLPTFHS